MKCISFENARNYCQLDTDNRFQKMTSKTVIVKHRFAKELIRCCGSHFKTIPSNERFAREFFLSSKYQLKVSREAVRKWFKGEAFPDLDYFLHLLEWLKLDISKIFHEKVSIDPKEIPLHIQSLNIEGINQITPEQIDAFVLLLGQIKKIKKIFQKMKNNY